MTDYLEIEELIKLIVTVIIAVVGWLIGNYFKTRQDIKNKKRDISLEHLISTYRILTNEISHRPHSKDREEKLEQVISDIQLFGSEKQIELSRKLAIEVSYNKEFQLDPLINDLRNELRDELNLKRIDGNVTWLRINT